MIKKKNETVKYLEPVFSDSRTNNFLKNLKLFLQNRDDNIKPNKNKDLGRLKSNLTQQKKIEKKDGIIVTPRHIFDDKNKKVFPVNRKRTLYFMEKVVMSRKEKFLAQWIKVKSFLGHQSISATAGWDHTTSFALLGFRNKITMLNGDSFLFFYGKAFYFLALILQQKGHIFIINTNPEFSSLVQFHFYEFINKEKSGGCISYCHKKYIGGSLTNWNQILRSIEIFKKFDKKFGRFIEKNQITIPKYEKLKTCFQGMINFTKKGLPDAIFLINPSDNAHIIREAKNLKIPVIGLCNSRQDTTDIDYPIPANSKNIFFVYFCIMTLKNLLKKLH